MRNHPFDRFFKEKLKNHSLPVPNTAWDGVKAGLATSANRSNRFSGWLLGMVLLVLGGLAIWAFLEFGTDAKSNPEVNATTPTSELNTIPKNSNQTAATLSQTQTQAETQTEEFAGKNESGSKDPSNKKTGPEKSMSPKVVTGSSPFVADQDRSSEDASAEMNKQSLQFSGSDTETAHIDRPQVGGPGQIRTTSTARDNSGSILDESKSDTNPLTDAGRVHIADEASIGKARGQFGVPQLLERNSLQGFSFDEKKEAPRYSPCMVKTSSDCYSFSPALNRIYLDLMAGPAYHMSELAAKQIESVDYAGTRENTEDYLFSFTAGIRASLVWNSGITASAGLTFTQLGEKFEYTDPDAVRETITNVVVDTIVGPGGNITLVWDTLSVIQTGERQIEHGNKYRFLDVPLTVGYELEGDRFNLYFNGGILVNLLFSQNGRILSPSNEVVYLQSGKSDSYEAYKTNAGISLVAGVGLAYKWRDDTHLLIEPQFRYFLKPLELGNYPVEHTVRMTSLRFGIRKLF